MMAHDKPRITVTTRGDLANQPPRQDTAIVVFLDPADAPFLRDWLDQAQDGQWGLFEPFVMLDTSIPPEQWGRVLKPKWWQPNPSVSIRQRLASGPNLEHAQRLVGLFPTLTRYREVVFACTYGKSRSMIASRAFEAWLNKNSMVLPTSLRERNPWWAHLLEETAKRIAQV